ncbi:MAG TPA: alpha/beta hydrolase [Jatrophihabitans sp.]|jgi:acetyl esterase|nr:alpha/beta hydrolase [Jatrophihabitans sp.]
MPLDPDLATLLKLIENAGYPPVAEATVEQARMGVRVLYVDFRNPALVAQVASVEDGTVAGSMPSRVYRPAADGPVPTIVYVHGGGWVIGDLDTHDSLCRRLCRDVGAVVVSFEYRLAPEHHFPAAVEDAYTALTWVAEHIDEYGGDATRLAIGGDSAGGNLAAVCTQRAHADGLSLAAQLLLYPAVDLLGEYPSRHENAEGYFLTLADMQWFAEHYLGLAETDSRVAELGRDPRLSPLLADSLADLPPAVVITAEFDPLRDEGNAYAKALAKAGVRVEHREMPGLIHGFCGLEQFSPAVNNATTWLNARFKELLG